MEAIVDIARHFMANIYGEFTHHSFNLPSCLVFNKREKKQVEVKIGEKEKGTFSLVLDSNHFANFSPAENLRETFESIFDYYIYQCVTRRLTGGEIKKINVIIPLSFSIAFENIFYKSLKSEKGGWEVNIYRDAEVYAAYYLNESSGCSELNYFARSENGAHVYGIITSGKRDCLVLFNYKPGDTPPELLQMEVLDDPAHMADTFKFMVKQNSNEKSRVFFFDERENRDNLRGDQNQEEEPRIQIDEQQILPARVLEKKNNHHDIFRKGIDHLERKKQAAPVFHFSLYSQGTRTFFPKIPLEKDFKLAVDFKQEIPADFFINLFVGPNPEHCILFDRVSVDITTEVGTHFEFKGRCRRLANGLKIQLYYKDKLKKECDFRLRNAYRIN